MRKVLLVRKDKLGDSLISTAVLRAMHRAEPSMRIDVLAHPAWRQVFDFHPAVDKVLLGPPKPTQLQLLRLIRGVRHEQYDAVVLLPGYHRRHISLAGFSGAPIRIAASQNWIRRHLLTHNLSNEIEAAEHQLEKYLALVQPLFDKPLERVPMEFEPAPDVAAAARDGLRGLGVPIGEQPVVLHVGTGGQNRPWRPEAYRRVASELAERGYGVVVTSAPTDVALAEQASTGIAGVVNVGGKTDLVQLRELLAGASLVVSVDTGVIHMAAATHTPSVVLYPRRDTLPEKWAPWMTPHKVIRPKRFCACCTADHCHRYLTTCVDSIDADEVMEAVWSMLGADNAAPVLSAARAKG